MKHVGLAVYLESNGAFWARGAGCYLLGKYQSHDEMCDISEYQMKCRFYFDEV